LILDNENSNKKVYEWLRDYTSEGNLDAITGYFTIGALGYLSQKTNEKINKYRFILGDIVNTEQQKNYTINLLNEDISIEASLKLKSLAREVVSFLKQNKVEVKTLEPNFCHAKAYIYNDKKDERLKYFISGSSNLTEAGIGLKQTNNVELNIAKTGDSNQFRALVKWFDELWNKPQAHYKKTVRLDDGKTKQQNFKEYLIEQIEKIFIEYSPKQLYYKVLFELFGEELLKEQEDPTFNREIGKLENSVIYQTLYPFQKKGVLSLIKMLQNYNGAILADAVGLGKTWSALAVMKYFQLQGYENILLCPKKLQNNWQQYLKKRGSLFESDQFDFTIRFHTDLFEKRLEKDGLTIADYFQSDKPKLLIIDESHNLRNAKSNRYKFLVETILKKNQNIKVLLLSATPINNSLIDIRNQFKLMTKDNDYGFYDSLGINSIDGIFRRSQAVFNRWIESDNKHISTFIKELPSDFFRLTDSLTVARTRKMIDGLKFPRKHTPKNIYVSPKNIGDYQTFTELFENLPPKLTAYKPAFYIEDDTKDVTKNEMLRDKALVKMIYMLLVKRFESSWRSFYDTIIKIQEYHKNIYNITSEYKKTKKDKSILISFDNLEDENINEEFSIGKREIKLSQIDKCGNLDNFINDLKIDINSMTILIQNLEDFKSTVESEKNYKSIDKKLEKLITIIEKKQKEDNKKLIVFTAYTDTALYLEKELSKRGVKKLALVHGNTKEYETILQRFAPYTKLYKEKQWQDFDGKSYKEWIKWIEKNDLETKKLLDNPIDILIATDVLSEGQNLQDADMVVNYDIHWNPVRVIQRMGRIDRIGSPNSKIYGVNFWPSKDINDYLGLQDRIEQKMATMKIVGSEVDTNFTENLKNMAEDDNLEKTQTTKMLKHMQISWEDIETNDESLGFNDLSLEKFRQELYEELQKQNEFYKNMPKGVFTGFKSLDKTRSGLSIIALLKNRINSQFELIYIDKKGHNILKNQKEILDFLELHKKLPRDVDKKIDQGDEKALKTLHDMIQNWVKSLSKKEVVDNNGIVKEKAGSKTVDVLNKLKVGQKDTLKQVKKNKTVEDEFEIKNYDLIVWFVVK
jgi:superfamily II DNA or RNA helicase